MKKGKIGTTLKKNKQKIPLSFNPLLIISTWALYLTSIKGFSANLAAKKLTKAPKEDPKEIIKTASKKLNNAPINIERPAAKGKEKAATKKYAKKKNTKYK